MKETIKIQGTIYQVEMETTADEMEEKKLLNIAKIMRENKVTRQLILKRPKGQKLYFANEFDTRHGLAYSKLTKAL